MIAFIPTNKKIFYAIIIAGGLIAGIIYLPRLWGSFNPNFGNPEKILYIMPACASSDCDCAHFATHTHAQWFHDNYDKQDEHRLDGNKDGVVCESLP